MIYLQCLVSYILAEGEVNHEKDIRKNRYFSAHPGSHAVVRRLRRPVNYPGIYRKQRRGSADTEKSSGCDIDVKDNAMTVTYKYDETYSKDQVKAIKKEMEKLVPDMAGDLEDSISDIKEESGIEDITMTIVFLNGDGSEIYSKEFN